MTTTTERPLLYTDYAETDDVRITATPPSPSVTGYGPKIPTRYMVRYARRWRRVYAMVYGNAGSLYLIQDGEVHHLDLDTEYLLGLAAEIEAEVRHGH